MTGAHDVVFQPEEVLAQGEPDVHLESTVHGGDTYEEPLFPLCLGSILFRA